jgi:hypothetical protein
MEDPVNNNEADSDGEHVEDGELMDRSGTNGTSFYVRLQSSGCS